MPIAHTGSTITTYHLCYAHLTHFHTMGTTQGIDQTQAICQAVQDTLTAATHLPHTHMFLWLQPLTAIPKLMILAPHRDTHITYDTCAFMTKYLDADPNHLLYIQGFQKSWLGSPTHSKI